MKRELAGFTAVLMITASSVTTASTIAAAEPSDPVAAGLRAGLGQVADWFATDVPSYDRFGQTLPLVDVVPGEDIQLADVFGSLIPFASANDLGTLDGVPALADAIAGEVEVDDELSFAVTAEAVDGNGLQVAVTITRLMDDVGFAVAREGTDDAPPVGIGSPVDEQGDVLDGVPVTLTFETAMTMRYAEDEFWIEADPAPAAAVTAAIDADRATADAEPFTVGTDGLPAAVGVLDTTVTEGSTLALDTTLTATLNDTDDDGVLQFDQHPGDGTTNVIPGEMRFALEDLIGTVARTGSATGSLTLEPATVTIDGDENATAQVSVTAPDLSNGNPVVGTDATYDDVFADFLNLDATELLGGLGQLFLAASVVQGHPAADIQLPFLGLSLRGVTSPADGLAQFVADNTAEVDPGNAAADAFGQATFTTVGELVDRLGDDDTGVPGLDSDALAPVYDPETQLLDLPVVIDNDLGTESPIEDEDGNQTGWLDFGDTLRDGAGIGALQHDQAAPGPVPTTAPARARTGGGVDLRWTVDLQPGDTSCDDPATADVNECDDPATPTIEELELPPVYERFGLRESAGHEIEVLSEVRVPVDGATGTAGWVEVIGADGDILYRPAAGASQPAVTIDLLLDGGHQTIHSFLQSLTSAEEGEPPPVVEDHLTIARDLAVTGAVELRVEDADGNDVTLGASGTAGLSIDWPTAHDSTTTASVSTTNSQAELLKKLDFDSEHRTALFGRVVDTVDGLLAQVNNIGTTGPTSVLLDSVPMLGRSLGSLAKEATALSDTIDAIRTAGPPGSLQGFEQTLQANLAELLGDGADVDLGWAIQDVGDDGTPDVVVDLDAASSYAEQLPFSVPVDVPGVGDLFGGADGGMLSLQVGAGLDLGFPVEVSAVPLPGAADLQVRESSALDVEGSATLGQDGTLGVSLGGVKVQLGPGGEAKLGAGVEVAVDGAGDGFVPAGDWLAGLEAQLQTDGQTCTTTTVAESSTERTVTGQLACVNLPILLNGQPIDPGNAENSLLQVSVDDLTIDSGDVEVPSNLESILAGQLLDLLGLADVFGQLTALLNRVFDATQWGSKIPFIGEHLTGDDEALGDITDAVDSFSDVLADPVAAADGVSPKASDLRTHLENAAAELPSDLLIEFPGEDTVKITLLCGGIAECADETETPATSVTGVEVELSLGQGDVTDDSCTTDCLASLPFDLGLPGLPLRATGSVDVGGGWRVDLGLGLSRDNGAYLLGNPRSSVPDGSGDPAEFVAKVAADLDGEVQASLGIFSAGIASNGDSTGVKAGFTANLPSDGDGRIGVGELVSMLTSDLEGTLNPTFDLSAGVKLDITAGTTSVGLPGLTTSLCYGFPASNCDDNAAATTTLTGGFDPSAAMVRFGEVKLELGATLESMLGDPLRFVGDITEPVEPVLDFLTAPIPVISELSRLFGGDDVTMLSLAKLLGMDESAGFIESVAAAVELANKFQGGTIVLADQVMVDTERAAGNRPSPDQAFEALTDGVTGMLGKPGEEDADSAAAVANEKGKVTSASSVTVPILESPGCLLTTVFGQDCDIVRWQPPPLKVEFSYDQAFGPFFGVLYVTIGGWAGAGAQFGLGMSTAGIREALDQADSVVGGLAFALHGLYIIDADGPELFLEAGIKAGGKIDAIIAAAGVEGGVKANLGFDLNDPVPDGRVHTTEVKQKIFTPLCLFSIAGKLTAFLQAWARLGVGPFSVRKTFKLAEVTLFDFAAALSEECDNAAPPVLATKVTGQTWDFGAHGSQQADVLRLNIGAHTGARGAFGNVKDEVVAVRELRAPVWNGNTPGTPGLYQVSAFGHAQEKDPNNGTLYEGYAVVFDAGDGNDNLVFSGGQNVDITTNPDLTGPGTPAFTSPVWGSLGAGTDLIQTGEGDDRIAGAAGTDEILLGRGNDRAHGDSQAGLDGMFSVDDAADSSGQADVIDGGEGNDTLFGGGEADEINGDAGTDTVNAGDGNDVAFGDDGTDTVTGGLGADTVYGGDGTDTLHGDTAADADDPNAEEDAPAGSADSIFAGPGNDTAFGGAGDDTVHGEAGDDTVFGQWHADTVNGSEGDDLLAGGPADDSVTGGDGHDKIWGDTRPEPDDAGDTSSDDSTTGGTDTIDGGPGSDFTDGGGGNDTIGGGPGNDGITGGWGQDSVQAGDGADLVAGDVATITGTVDAWTTEVDENDGTPGDANARDTILGDGGNDTVHGQSGGDEIHAGLGADVVRGNAGEDEIWGDGGADEIHGNTDDDLVMAGPDDDHVFGGPDSDEIYGHAGRDRVIGGSAGTTADDAGDVIYGGGGEDVALGDNGTIGDVLDVTTIVPVNGNEAGTFGDDHLGGGDGRDVLHGQDGDDQLFGDAGDDQAFGELGEDWLVGGMDHDTLLGDQGTVTPAAAVDPDSASGPGRWPGGAPQWAVQLVAPNDGGADQVFGRSGDDHLYGGWLGDYLEGGAGDDVMEGNGGRDTMYGNEPADGSLAGPMPADEAAVVAADPRDADDMIGGSSDVNGEEAKLDEGEFLMFGNEHEDVMAGDNANITGVVAPDDPAITPMWAIDDVTGGRLRQIELLDREKSASTAIPLADVSGPDLMYGNEGNDRMHGQGGTDILKGNEDDDFVQGNQDRDLLEGNAGEDDLVGGSAFLSPFVGTPDEHQPDQGDYDAGDEIYGGDGADVAIGDNGVVTRVCQEGVDYTYATTQLGIGKQRCIQLFDLAAPPAEANFGPDVISGGAGVDVLFGQDADDIVAGGPHDDYMEGNGGDEWLFGDSLASEVKADPPTVTLPYQSLPADVQAELALPAPGTLVFPPSVPFFDTCPLDDDTDNNDCRSPVPELEGPDGPDGQDDQIGGSSRTNHRDGDDVLFGDGAADFQLGDNGRLDRTIADGVYLTYADYNPTTVVRDATRYDVAGPEHTHGGDVVIGATGDDYQWGQDGNDALLGQDHNDEQYGELGGDWIDGARGQDAQVGDRGGVVSRLLGPGEQVTTSTGGPAFFDIVLMREGTFDRRVSLLHDADGTALEHPGLSAGGADIVLGGPGHDVMHGAFGGDVMTGSGGGDWMYGDDGADVMWGGHGCVPGDPEDGVNDSGAPCAGVADPGESDQFVDIMFGGHGGTSGDEVLDADILDFRPRAGVDPPLWHLVTGTLNDDPADPTTIADNDHHHGVDWIYGGWDRDVLQGDIGKNGPEPDGDRLIDWVGAFNLYTRCNPSYGDDGDIRQRSPQMETLLETLAFGTGVGASMDDVRDPASSAYRELALVYKTDTNGNNGKAFPETPGHFDQPSCQP